MRKYEEMTRADSCLARARDEEMTFVLLGRDVAAPAAIRAWIAERIRLGKNRPDDAQVREAEQCARTMEADRPGPATTEDPRDPAALPIAEMVRCARWTINLIQVGGLIPRDVAADLACHVLALAGALEGRTRWTVGDPR
jgi:hypothetical protein